MPSIKIVYLFISQALEHDSPKPCHLIWKIKNTMVGLPHRRPETFRRIGEMSRWRQLSMRRYKQRNHIQQHNIYSNLFSHGGIFDVYGIVFWFLSAIYFSKKIASSYIPTTIFVYIEYVLLPTTEFINYLSQKLLQYINSPIIMCF